MGRAKETKVSKLVKPSQTRKCNKSLFHLESYSDYASDANNFINFCVGKTITNGLQNTAGSCNGIGKMFLCLLLLLLTEITVMGDIPATTQMVSTIITSPKFGDTIAPNQEFPVKLQVKNLQAGSFTNPDITYYSAPQELNAGGTIIGHVHVRCRIGSIVIILY